MAPGSSYLPSELNAAFLFAQMKKAQRIYDDRIRSWNLYYELLTPLRNKGLIELPIIPEECTHNAHMFYIKVKNVDERAGMINHLKEKDIKAVFHYIPLHSSPAGKMYGKFVGDDCYTTSESERLLRLPMYFGLKSNNVEYIVTQINEFYK